MVTINLQAIDTESLRKLAYVLVHSAAEARSNDHAKEFAVSFAQCLHELEQRPHAGDVSELLEMFGRVTIADARRMRDPAAAGRRAAADR